MQHRRIISLHVSLPRKKKKPDVANQKQNHSESFLFYIGLSVDRLSDYFLALIKPKTAIAISYVQSFFALIIKDFSSFTSYQGLFIDIPFPWYHSCIDISICLFKVSKLIFIAPLLSRLYLHASIFSYLFIFSTCNALLMLRNSLNRNRFTAKVVKTTFYLQLS